jgi:hypothetical protein
MEARRRHGVKLGSRPLSTGDIDATQPSLLFKLLPSYVRNRVPKVPSLRRSYNEMSISRSLSSTASSGIQTPPPSYSSAAPSESGDDRESMDSLPTDVDSEDPTVALEGSIQHVSERRSANSIKWKYGRQGRR